MGRVVRRGPDEFHHGGAKIFTDGWLGVARRCLTGEISPRWTGGRVWLASEVGK